MRILSIVCFILLSTSIVHAQNLVPNFSFEDYSICPTAQGQLNNAISWSMPPNTGSASSDYYHGCSSSGFSTPGNVTGYQIPNTGQGYAGFYVYGVEVREYLQTQLISPLIAGTEYLVEMYVCPSEAAGIAVDAIGIHISTGPISGSGTFAPMGYIPQISNPVNYIISDTLNWTKITGTYLAQGGEDHITIGNFKADSATNNQTFNTAGWGRGYYRVDDISVSMTTSLNTIGNNSISVYPNPFTEEVIIKSEYFTDLLVTIYDVKSRIVIQQNFNNYLKLNLTTLQQGLYFYEIRGANDTLKRGKLLKQ